MKYKCPINVGRGSTSLVFKNADKRNYLFLFVLFCNQAKILKIDNTVLAIVQEDRLSSMVGRN